MLDSDDAIYTFVGKILNEERNKEPRRQLQEEWEFLKRLGPQWDSTNLLNCMREVVSVRPRSNVGFLAVTQMDLYSNESRYVFGLAEQNANCGIVSYRRYKSDLLDEPTNRERLRQRTLKQALSSTGLLFGIPRCTDPTCARAYANSLTEHDAKEVRLCSQCRDGFHQRFK
jgi:predicted Zn-dependent protease